MNVHVPVPRCLPWVLAFSAAVFGVSLLRGEGSVGERGGLGWPEQPGGFGELGAGGLSPRWMGCRGSVGNTRAAGVPEPAPALGKMLSKDLS